MTDKATGKAAIAGEIEAVEPDGANYKTKFGLLIVFDSAEALRNALKSGECVFSVFGEKPSEPANVT